MVPPRWAILSIEQTLTALGFIFVVKTDVPCHLWCRITTHKPWMHLQEIVRRGVGRMADPYFCFVAWHDNEQEEDGDTIIHTFEKAPWPVCETRWFYFHGTIGGVAVPSTSCIFEKHRTEPPIVEEWHIFKETDIGWHVGKTGTWPGVWTAPTGTGMGDHLASVVLVHENYWGTGVYIIRGWLLYDTSAIPPGATIVEGFLRLYPAEMQWKNPYKDLVLQASAEGVPHDPCQAADYSKDHFSGNLGQVTLPDVHQHIDVNLNAAGLVNINKGGTTVIGTRLNGDVEGINPRTWGVGSHRCVIYADWSPVSERYCYLALKY